MNRGFLCFSYQHTESMGLVHCNSNLPAIVQEDVTQCNTQERYTLITRISNSSLPSVKV
jgi:hypothetical protein